MWRSGHDLQASWHGKLSTITVDTFDDVIDAGDGLTSLREAIIQANGGGGETIVLGEGTYTLSINNGATDDVQDDLDIHTDVSIVGVSPTKTIIDGGGAFGVFEVHDDGDHDVSFSNLKIQNGFRTGAGSEGAGLQVEGTGDRPVVEVVNVWFADNHVSGIGSLGGSIANYGDLTLENVTVEGSSAEAAGGIFNAAGGTIDLTNVTVSGNSASAGDAGGLANGGTATLTNVTVADNLAYSGNGGGIVNAGGSTTLINTLIADNVAASNDDLDGSFISSGFNLIETPGSASGLDASDIIGFDPGLGQLTGTTGFTPTHGIAAASAAHNTGTSAGTPSTDQRGEDRDAYSDIGAYEVIPTTVLNATADTYIDKNAANLNYGASTSLVVDKSGSGHGNQRALLEFDLSSIPVGATITGAALQMEATSLSDPFDISVYQMTESWVEGTGDGTDVAGADWTTRDDATSWASGVGGSFVTSSPVATLSAKSTGQHRWDITSLVQQWHDGTSANHGLLLGSPDSGTESVTYDSREGVSVPELVITYEVNSLWLSTDLDVSSSGVDGLASWVNSEALALGDPDLTLGSGTSDGTLGLLFDLDDFVVGSANVDGLHYVTTNMTLGSVHGQDLRVGDVLFSTKSDEQIIDTGLVFQKTDVMLFRPNSPGDYTSGTFSVLIDGLGNGGFYQLQSFTLVEESTTFGDITVDAGDFLYAHSEFFGANDVYLFQTAEVGNGTTSGTAIKLLEGDDLGLSVTSSWLLGMELLENDTNLGGTTYSGGTLLLQSTGSHGSVGDTATISTTENDIFAIDVIQTIPGSANSRADAYMVLRGGDIGLDSSEERIAAIAIGHAGVPNTAPTGITHGSLSINEHTDTSGGYSFGLLGANDPDSSETFTWSKLAGGDGALFTLHPTTGELILDDGVLDHEAQEFYTVGVRVTDSANNSYDDTITVTVIDLNDAPVLADQSPTLTDISVNDFGSDGDSVASIIVDGSISDQDGAATESMAIVGVDDSNGTWQFSTDNGGTWSDVDDGSLSPSHALLLDGSLNAAATQKLRFVPDAGYDGTATLTFVAWDKSAGSAGTYDDASMRGGSTAFSDATDTAMINVNPSALGITARETVDSDADGQIDHIRITTSANLDDDFGGLTVTVSGYALDATTPYLTDLGGGGDHDNVFYVKLVEGGTPDTGATPTVTVTANTTLSEFGGGGDLSTDAGGVASDGAGAVLVAAVSPQIMGTTLFQSPGHHLELIFSESLAVLPSEADLESALVFASGATDGDNLPSIGTGADPFSLVSTTFVDDTIRITLQADNTLAADGLLVGTHSIAVVDGTTLTDLSANAANVAAAATIIGELNDAPTLTATPQNPTFTEGGVAAQLYGESTANTIESGQTFVRLVFTVTGIADGDDEIIRADGIDIELTDANSGTTTDHSLSFGVSVTGSTATVTLSGGSLDTTELQTLVETMTYRNSSDDPATSDRIVTLTSLQDSGGTLGGGNDTATLSIASTVSVNAVNQAPTLSGGPYSLPGTDEDTTSVGRQVSTILGGLTSGDAEGASLGLAVIDADGNGEWQYSTDSTDGIGGNWTTFPTVSASNALLLSDTTWVRYAPDTMAGESASLTFRAWDGTGGSASGFAAPSTSDPAGGGGTSPFSAGTAQATVSVTDLNDAPTDITLTSTSVSENDSGAAVGTVTVADSDPSDTHVWGVSDSRFEVTSGQLRLKAGQSLDRESEPTVDVTLTATDQGGHGVAFDKTFTIIVDNVDEAPTADGESYSISGNTTLIVTSGDGVLVGDADPEGASLDAVLLIDVAHGTLTLSDDGSFVYTPDIGFFGADSFTYEAWDGALSSAPAVVTIQVSPAIIPVSFNPPPPPDPDPDPPADPDPPREASGDGEPVDSDPAPADTGDASSSSPAPTPALAPADGSPKAGDGNESGVELVAAPESSDVKKPQKLSSQQQPAEATDDELASDRKLTRRSADELIDSATSVNYALMARPGAMWNELDEKLNQVDSQIHGDLIVVGTAGAAASSFTVGIVAWSLRTGFLASGLLAQLPAWRGIDPMLIMQSFGKTEGTEETLEELMKRQSEALGE